MPTIRTITTSLLLGMLLLPPHWCCAFPAKAADRDGAATQLRPCCAIHRTVSTATSDSPAAGNPQPLRSCCSAASAAETLLSAMPQPSHADERCVTVAPADTSTTLPCAFCSPRIGAVQKSASLPVADDWLSTTSDLLPPVSLASTAVFVRYGATLPISGDTLALLCRWNC